MKTATPDIAHPTEQFLRSIDIHLLLPQQEPFVMVGRLVGFDDEHTVTETLVAPGNLFVDGDGHFTAAGMIENIAQTCVARIGYVNKFILGRDLCIGYIGAIKNMEVHCLPSVGDLLTTTVSVHQEVFGITLATAEIACGDRLMASTEIKTAIKETQNGTQDL